MNILITGGSGSLGKELVKEFPDALTPTHQELDITDAEAVKAYFKKNKIDFVIHAAALTGIRQCEGDKIKAIDTNIIGTANIALHAKRLIYISTACVFSGDDELMYDEDCVPNPKNVYSLTKLAGERVVLGLKQKNRLIVRTNFIGLKEFPYEKSFTDRSGTYLLADDVARAIKSLVNSFNIAKKETLIHICGRTPMSMYDLAQLVNARVGSKKIVAPTTLADYTGPPLTKNMCLATNRWAKFEINRGS